MKNKAMTLAETLVVMFLLGVVASVTIPALWHARPNDSRMMFRKAYYDAERVISDMINDESLYPELFISGIDVPADFGTVSVMADFPVKDSSGNPVKNEDGSIKTEKREAVVVMGTEYKGETKFCGLFADKMNISGEPNCTINKSTNVSYDTPSFTATNGIAWYVPTTENIFTFIARNGAPAPPIVLRVDINGAAPPNCRCNVIQDATESLECPTECPNPDRFEILVETNGKMEVQGVKEVEYLSTSDLK